MDSTTPFQMRLFAFHIVLVPLGKVWIQLWVNSWTLLFNLGMAACVGNGKLWIQTSCRPGEGWALLGYSSPTHTTDVATYDQN